MQVVKQPEPLTEQELQRLHPELLPAEEDSFDDAWKGIAIPPLVVEVA